MEPTFYLASGKIVASDFVLGRNTKEKYLCGQNHKRICFNNSQKGLLICLEENFITFLSLTRFQDFPALEIVTIKFHDFPGFLGLVRTLLSTPII